VVQSIGQAPDYVYLSEELKEKINITRRGQLEINEQGQVKGAPWLFAGGDIVNGPDIIHGIADGHDAARGIDKYLMGR
jgi:glutamate synthase (NADPH/NADH) small chain